MKILVLEVFLYKLYWNCLNNYYYQLSYFSEDGIFYKNVKHFTQNVILFIVFFSFKNGGKVKHESGKINGGTFISCIV